jgi:hypothetical protein
MAAAAAAAAAAKQCSSDDGAWAVTAGGAGAEAGQQPDSPAVVEMTVLNMEHPAAAPAPAVPTVPSATQGTVTIRTCERAPAQPEAAARAEAGGTPAAPGAGAAAAAAVSAPSPGAAARVQQAMRQWYSRQGAADREAQEAARRQQLAWLRRPDDEPEPEVRFQRQSHLRSCFKLPC